MSRHYPGGARPWTRQPKQRALASREFDWDVLVNQAFPGFNAATGRPVTPRGTLMSGGGFVGRNWYGVNALESINAPMPTTATGYTAIWVGPMNVSNTGTPVSMIRTTGSGFRLESYTTPGGAYISLTHTGVAVGPTIAAASWSTFTNDPFVVIATYDGTTVRVGWRPPPAAGLNGALEGAATIGMNTGTGTIDLSTSSGSFGAYLVGYAARSMPVSLMRRLLLNPWQVFEPREREVFYSLGGGPVSLVLTDIAHAHAADAIALTQAHALAAANAVHAHAADGITLSVTDALVLADTTHGHTADSVSLTQAHALAAADATHGHTADALTLTQVHQLGADNVTHGHTADSVTLVLPGQLDVQSITHGHGVDAVTLSQVHALAVQDALHPHAADNLTFSGSVALVLADALHGHAVDGVALTQVHALVVDGVTHGHTVDSVTLASGLVLAIADAIHTHTADTLTATQVHVLVVSDAVHSHLAQQLGLSIPGSATGPKAIIVQSKARSIVVVAKSRTIVVEPNVVIH